MAISPIRGTYSEVMKINAILNGTIAHQLVSNRGPALYETTALATTEPSRLGGEKQYK